MRIELIPKDIVGKSPESFRLPRIWRQGASIDLLQRYPEDHAKIFMDAVIEGRSQYAVFVG